MHLVDDSSGSSLDMTAHSSLSLMTPLKTASFVTYASSSSSLSGELYPPRYSFPRGLSSRAILADYVQNESAQAEEEDESQQQQQHLSSIDKAQNIRRRLDQCETTRWPGKKKLILENMHLEAEDIPVDILSARTNLGSTLYKLSLAGNHTLRTIPSALVRCLPTLKHLDLSLCNLATLPEVWNLPQLKKLNLSYNHLTEFPNETMLEGLPELKELNMYGNKVTEIVVPQDLQLLSKLEVLNMGYNDLMFLPDDLDQIQSLQTLQVANNFLQRVPMRVCVMNNLRTMDVSSNPIIQPPIETCERGIWRMRRYYHCLLVEEQSRHNALRVVQSRLLEKKNKKREKKRSFLFRFR